MAVIVHWEELGALIPEKQPSIAAECTADKWRQQRLSSRKVFVMQCFLLKSELR